MKHLHLLPLGLALAGVLSLNCLAADFPDVPETHWAVAYVDKLSDDGVILGRTDGIVPTSLSDLSGTYADAVESAVRMGLLTGYPDGTFGGNSTLTRAEAAVIITRLQARSTLEDGLQFAAAWGDTWRYCYRLADGRLTALPTVGGSGYSDRSEEEAAAEQSRLDALWPTA